MGRLLVGLMLLVSLVPFVGRAQSEYTAERRSQMAGDIQRRVDDALVVATDSENRTLLVRAQWCNKAAVTRLRNDLGRDLRKAGFKTLVCADGPERFTKTL